MFIPPDPSFFPTTLKFSNSSHKIHHHFLCRILFSLSYLLSFPANMSSSRQVSSGRRRGMLPEKSSFAQTCNLLSQYIKDKGSIRDLNLEIGDKIESIETIVKHGSSSHSASYDDPTTSKHAAATDSMAAQLTIFYSGEVMVFNDYPAEKAEELVAFATNGGSQMRCGILPNTLWEKPILGASAAATSTPGAGLPPRPEVGISSNTCKDNTIAASGAAAEAPQTLVAGKLVSLQPDANGSDLPIARRSSLHRFLEKRKDRAAAVGPYQLQEQPSSSSKGDGQLDLNL